MKGTTVERLARQIRWTVSGRGWRAGSGAGKRLGTAGEFEGYRPFQPGDDLRLLDSRVFARHRSRVARVLREDSGLPVTLLIDGSASMGDAHRRAMAAELVELFVALARRLGDPLRGYVLAGTGVTPVPRSALPRFGEWWTEQPLVAELDFQGCFQATPPDPAGQGVTIVISDALGLEEPERALGFLARWSRVFWIAPWISDERDPPWSGTVRLTSTEREASWTGFIDARTRDEYRANLHRFEEGMIRRLRAWGGDFLPVHAEQPLLDVLDGLRRRGTLIA